jgi:subtilase family serine protease
MANSNADFDVHGNTTAGTQKTGTNEHSNNHSNNTENSNKYDNRQYTQTNNNHYHDHTTRSDDSTEQLNDTGVSHNNDRGGTVTRHSHTRNRSLQAESGFAAVARRNNTGVRHLPLSKRTKMYVVVIILIIVAIAITVPVVIKKRKTTGRGLETSCVQCNLVRSAIYIGNNRLHAYHRRTHLLMRVCYHQF